MIIVRSHLGLQTRMVAFLVLVAILPVVRKSAASPPSTQPSDPKRAEASATAIEPGRVFVLTGITGATRRTRHLSEIIRRYAQKREEQLSVEVIDWPHFEVGDGRNSMIRLLQDDEHNRTRARLVADRIREARKLEPHTKFFLLAKSAGGLMAVLACQSMDSAGVHLLADGTFESIVLISISLPADRDVSALHAKCRRGVFNYFSAEDPVLVASQALSTKKPAGLVGLAPNKNARIWQLDFANVASLDNDGGHWGSFREEFFGRYFMPLLSSCDLAIPAGWRQCE